MPISLKNLIGPGQSIEIGECVMLQDQPEPIIELDGMTFLKSGNVLMGEQGVYPEAYEKFGKSSNSLDEWVPVDAVIFSQKYDLKYLGGKWVSPSLLGRVFWSDDATEWSMVTTGADTILNAIEYANDTWVAVGNSGKVTKSTDLSSWTVLEVPEYTDRNLLDIVWGGGMWVVVASGTPSTVLTSIDLVNWVPVTVNKAGLRKISYIEGKWYLGTSSGLFIGNTLEELSLQESSTLTDTIYKTYKKNGVYVAASLRCVWYSLDGEDWIRGDLIDTTGSHQSFYFDGEWAVMVLGYSPRVVKTKDFNNWEPVEHSWSTPTSVWAHEGVWVIGESTLMHLALPTPLLGLQSLTHDGQSTQYMRIK